MAWIIKQTVDLARGDRAGQKQQSIQPLAYPGNENAHRWEVTVLRNGLPFPLSGYAASAEFDRPDGNRVASVSHGVSDNVAWVEFPADVYTVEGMVNARLSLSKSGEDAVLAAITFRVSHKSNGPIIDPSGVITLYVAALIAEIEEVRSGIPRDYARLVNEVDQLMDLNAQNLLIRLNFPEGTQGGVTCTYNGNGSYTLVGTAGSSSVYFDLWTVDANPPYFFNLGLGLTYRAWIDSTNIKLRFAWYDSSNVLISENVSSGTDIFDMPVPVDAAHMRVSLVVPASATVNDTVYPYCLSTLTNYELTDRVKAVEAVAAGAVRFDTAQTLTEAQKGQARDNIEAASGEDVSELKSAFDEVTATTDNMFDDAYALEHAADVTLENGAFVGSVTAFGDFVLLPHGSFETGKTYTISFDAMESGTGATGKLGIFLKTESGGNVSSDALNADNSTWHHYSFTYTFADTVYYVRFGRTNTTTNTWYIKNIVINAGSAEIPYEQHLTAYDLVARKANEAISKYSLAYDLYPTGDTTKRNAEMLTVLTEKGLCRLAPGEYYVDYLYMPKGTALIGAGIGKTKIIKDGSGSSYTVRLREECEIGNMTLSGYPTDIVAPETLGSGRIGVRIQGTGNDNTQRFHCTIHDMEIINCDYAGVSIYGTGYSPESGCHLFNLYIRQCGYGIFLSSYAEFHIISDVNATYCTCGVGNYGGNNTFTGFNLSRNAIGVLMDNTSDNYPNNAHGAFTGGSINHNSEYAIKMIKTIAGQIFSSVNVFDNGIFVDSCTGVHFDTLNCGSSAPVVLNGSQPVFFTNCIFMANESPISGDNTPIIVNCYTRGGAAWGA